MVCSDFIFLLAVAYVIHAFFLISNFCSNSATHTYVIVNFKILRLLEDLLLVYNFQMVKL